MKLQTTEEQQRQFGEAMTAAIERMMTDWKTIEKCVSPNEKLVSKDELELYESCFVRGWIEAVSAFDKIYLDNVN